MIQYIASSYRKDKIWLRRTKPAKRQYQILIAVDDSESMADNGAGRMAVEAVALLCCALAQLEVGELSVVSFGDKVQELHPFSLPFTGDAGARVLSRFTFAQVRAALD